MDETSDADDAPPLRLDPLLLPLARLEPTGETDDLEPLRALLEGVSVVGLGESTHGVHEFFAAKHRLVELLVVELGFTVLALEASWAGCQPINDYVQHRTGDRDAVLRGQRYLAWDTEEFAALLESPRPPAGPVPRTRPRAGRGALRSASGVTRPSVSV